MAELAVVSPPTYAPVLQKGPMLMALAHWVLGNRGYGAYFANMRRTEGTTVILDNGSFELHEPLAVDALVGAAAMAKADIVVLPDWMRDSNRTLYGSWAALSKFSGLVPGVMFVPQGDKPSDYIKCLDLFMTQWTKYNMEDTFSLTLGLGSRRMDFAMDMMKYECPVHLLGMPFPDQFFSFDLPLLTENPLVKSIDTSWPVALAQEGSLLNTSAGKPKINPAGGFSAENLRLARLNVQILRKWVREGEATNAIPYDMIKWIATDGGNLTMDSVGAMIGAAGMPAGYYKRHVATDCYEYAGQQAPPLEAGMEVTRYVPRIF